MEFITQNYLWIIFIIIVIVMAVVGYVAEKKEFIKKGVKVEKTKKEPEQPIVIDDKGIDELLKDAVDKDKKKDKKDKKKKDDKKEETVVEPISEITAVNEDLNAPLVSDINEDLTSPLVSNINEDLTSPLVSEPVNEDNIDQSLFAPLEPVGETNELNSIEVSTLPEEPAVINPEEDIWKF